MNTAQVQKRKRSDLKFSQFARDLAKSLLNDAVIVQLPLMQFYVFRVPLSQPYAFLEATITKLLLCLDNEVESYKTIELKLELRIYQWFNDYPVEIGIATLHVKIEDNPILEIRKFRVELGKPKEVPLECIEPVKNIFQKVRLVQPPETTQVIEIY